MDKQPHLRSRMIGCCDYFYDTLSGLISLLDVITDIIILIYYYKTSKQIFFLLSLSILLFAQLSYGILFIIRFASHFKIRHKILIFILILPLCPFMSYIFYWSSLRNNKLSHIFKYIGLKVCEYEPPSESQAEKLGITKLQEYFAEKLINHTGFVLEAIFESFPQSILQCIAMILYYNSNETGTNGYLFSSILISLISISAKSLMFSGSLNIPTFFFNWLCAISDFFGLYLIFVWVFFVPEYYYHIFGEIWLYKFIICTVTPIIVGTFILSIFIAIDLYDDITLDMYRENFVEYFYKFIIIIVIIILFTILWSFSVIILIIFGEILCCTWIAIGFYYYNESRFSHSRTFMKIFYWLYLSNNNEKDLLLRLISVNYRLSHGKMMNDIALHTFLTNVIKNDLRFNSDNNNNNNKNKDIEFEFDKQRKQLSDYYEEYEGINTEQLRDFGTSLLTSNNCILYTWKSLSDIKYKDFRIRCKNKHKTHLISVVIKQMIKPMIDDKLRISELNSQLQYATTYSLWFEIRIAKLIVYIQLIADYILWFLFIPLYAISRIFNLLIPIICLCLVPSVKYITFFQWILTALYFILLIALIILFPYVWKFQFIAWHVAPGYDIISPKIHNDNNIKEIENTNHMQEEYTTTTTLEEILSDRSEAQQTMDTTATATATTATTNVNNGTRRARRIRRKHKRQQRKQKKKKLKKIREKIRKYEKLEFYEWVKEFYNKCISIPLIRNQIINKFGNDIGQIIFSYLPSIIDENDNVIMKEFVYDDCCDEYNEEEEQQNEYVMDNEIYSKTSLPDSYCIDDDYDDQPMDCYSQNGNNSNNSSYIEENDANNFNNIFNLEDNNFISSQQRNRNHQIINQSSLLCYSGEDIENLNCNNVNLNELYTNCNSTT